MRTIHKYPLAICDEQEIRMPKGAIILTAMMQTDTLCLWAEVETQHTMVGRRIVIIGTGHALADTQIGGRLNYIASVIDQQFVWHVYEAR